jgi:hypothetical protein
MEHKRRDPYNAFARRKQANLGIAAALKSSMFIGRLALAREDDRKLEWRKRIRQLRFYRNKFDSTQQLSENFTRLESNNFLTPDVMRRRNVLRIVHKIHSEFVILSLDRDVLLDDWQLSIYV